MERMIHKMIISYKFKIIGEKRGYIDTITIDDPHPDKKLIEDLKTKYEDNIFLVDMEKVKKFYQMKESTFIQYSEDVTEKRLRGDV